MQIRQACSSDYYCLRETVIAEKMKHSFISHHHSLFGNLHENQPAAIEMSKYKLLQEARAQRISGYCSALENQSAASLKCLAYFESRAVG